MVQIKNTSRYQINPIYPLKELPLMGKRSNFERKERDFYATPEECIVPLLPFLRDVSTFAEPCAGDGSLVRHLEKHWLTCNYSSDIEPLDIGIMQLDAMKLSAEDVKDCDVIISNTPWTRSIFHPMLEHFCSLKPTWLLADADWVHTRQSYRYVQLYLKTIVSIGRVKWFNNTSGKDNAVWMLFEKNCTQTPKFYGRGV
jgi:hypothetical protein